MIALDFRGAWDTDYRGQIQLQSPGGDQSCKMNSIDQIGSTWQSIAVTGPERSGTNIAAKMIASSLQYEYVSEDTWGSNFEKLWSLLNSDDRKPVVHAPHLTYRVHEISQHCGDEVLVVFMLRPIEEIVASQRRIGWGRHTGLATEGEDPKGWGNEASEWFDRPSYEAFCDIIDPDHHLCENRQHVWHARQKQRVKNYIEVSYDSLRSHPMWVEPNRRKNFGSHQTEE